MERHIWLGAPWQTINFSGLASQLESITSLSATKGFCHDLSRVTPATYGP